MKIAIMQPYLFPYIGYFQLLNAADEFVVYDNIEYTKKGWINRNRILQNGSDAYISIPLRKDSDYLHIRDRFLADNWPTERKKLLNKIAGNYRKAPFFNETFALIEECLMCDNQNLFYFIFNSIQRINNHLNIKTMLRLSSSLSIDHQLKSQDKVLAICQNIKSETYINPIGGLELYSNLAFTQNKVNLLFLKPELLEYVQFGHSFVSGLSIIDVLMFNSVESIKKEILNQYELISNG